MPTCDFLNRLGVLVAKGFFDAALCARLRAELRAARGEAAVVYRDDGQLAVKRSVRRASLLKVAPDTISLVDARLGTLRPALEGHFRVPLRGWEDANFLRYVKGDYYHAHRDANPTPEAPDYLQARRVSIVLFLNGEASGPEDPGYAGGNLTLYGLVADPRWASYGFPLRGEEGLLVAFRSDVLHEVTPVTHGERFTLVTWYY
jgi:predicted 2-oxoglutarate/Fe(II)-dependent dioxygenase YbiX